MLSMKIILQQYFKNKTINYYNKCVLAWIFLLFCNASNKALPLHKVKCGHNAEPDNWFAVADPEGFYEEGEKSKLTHCH